MPLRVLIGGSDYRGKEAADFINACRAIGKALVSQGLEVVVGSDAPQTADLYVLEGANEVPGTHPVVVVWRQDRDRERPFNPTTASAEYPNIAFATLPFSGDWTAGRVLQFAQSDALMLIGGGNQTKLMGQAAIATGKPVLPVPTFGGAAKELWDSMRPPPSTLRRVKGDLELLRNPWSSAHADSVVRILQQLSHSAEGNSLAVVAGLLASVLILFAALITLLAFPISPRLVSLGGVLLIAALLGTGLRTVTHLLAEPDIKISATRTLTEATGGVLVAVGLFLLYFAGGLTIVGNAQFIDQLDQRTDYFRLAVVLGLLGFFSGYLFEDAAQNLTGRLERLFPGARK
jgi:hypothetical protein